VCNPRRRRYAYRRRRRSSTCVAGNGPEHRRSTSSWLSRSHSQADFRTKLTLSYTDVDENPSLRYRRRGHKRDTPTLAVEHTCSVPPTPPAPRTSRTLARGTVASSVASEISGIVVDRRRGSADQLSTWEQREHGVRGRTSVEAYVVTFHCCGGRLHLQYVLYMHTVCLGSRSDPRLSDSREPQHASAHESRQNTSPS
jgi:hypothetical protein